MSPLRKIGKHRGDARRSGARGISHRRKFRQHRVHAARAPHAIIRDRDHDPHFQNELKKIGPQHAPQAAERNVKSRERNQKENADRETRRLALAEHGSHDARHRLGHPAEDQAIHQQPEIDGAKSAQKRGRFSRVAHLRKLHVGEQARTPPQPREQKHGHHSRRQKTPPQPVARDSLRVDESRHDQRRVRRKRRRHHRRSREPPRHLPPRYKIFFRVPARTPPKINPQHKHQQQISGDHGPVE